MRHSTATLSLILLLGLAPFTNSATAKPSKPVVAPGVSLQGPGDLLVAPGRLVFDMRKRTAALNLSNIGSSKATYRISLVRMEMDANGGLVETPLDTRPGAVDLPGLIRFSPREITLGPREAQTIRLQVRKPAGLPAGEYRIHMMFRAVPPVPEAPNPGDQAERPKGISVKLIPVYGLAIPLIVRQGETSAKAGISALAYDPLTRSLRFHLNREGNQSMYGDLKVRWIPKGGSAVTLAETTGVAVYASNATRMMEMSLGAPKGTAALAAGRLQVTFAAPPLEGGRVQAEEILELL